MKQQDQLLDKIPEFTIEQNKFIAHVISVWFLKNENKPLNQKMKQQLHKMFGENDVLKAASEYMIMSDKVINSVRSLMPYLPDYEMQGED